MKRLFNFSTRDLVPGGFFYLAIAAFFCAFAFIVISQRVWDYDFWWHLATGRYIVENGHIPQTDPFSFTSDMPENSNLHPLREKFILSQYWLAQIIFYYLYNTFGPAGTALLRSVLYLGTLFVIYRTLKDRGAFPYITFLSLFLASYSLLRFFGDRPVLFTISFSVFSFLMIDDYVRKRSRLFFLLPALMVLWANLHGGFILGIAIIGVFMAIEAIKLILGKSIFTTKEKVLFFSVMLLAIAASGINPNGFFGFEIAFSKEYAAFYEGIQEYESPFRAYKMKFFRPDYSYVAALVLFPVVLLLRNRKFNPAHLALLLFLAVASISAGRFTVYYGLIASVVLGNELDLWLKEHQKLLFFLGERRLNTVFSIVMLASSLLYFSAMATADAFDIKESRWAVPKSAADFISENHIKGNMLNDMGAGGYFSWRLYPEVKTFIDTRALNYTVLKEYAWLSTAKDSAFDRPLQPGKTPLWKRLLDHYKINVIVFNPFDIYGNLIPLTLNLVEDEDWVPVFSDVMAVIFVRNIPGNSHIINKFRLAKDDIYNTMILRASLTAGYHTKSPYHVEALGDIFSTMGNKKEAIKAYEYALKRMPGNLRFQAKLDKVKTEITEVKK